MNRCAAGGVASSESCRGSLSQDHLVQSQIGDRPTQRLVLGFQGLQPFQLIPAHPSFAVGLGSMAPAGSILAPVVAGLNLHSDLANRLRDRLPLTLQKLNLPQL